MPVRFVRTYGYGEIAAGTMMIALSAPMVVVPLLASLLARWIPAATLSAVGLVLCACGLLWLASASDGPHGASAASLAPPMLLIGFGRACRGDSWTISPSPSCHA
ncbi:MAG TPA: hypothetical protein VNO21_13800, partial [Polyangiaceae bacterium]|nr:hypothetical protein [Polyangiaceae bacterium]